MPKVSVIVPAYNRARFVAEAVRSVLAQTLRDFELIVVDDGSQDGTAEAVEAIRDPRIRLFRNPRNLGIAATQNFALRQVRGAYVAFLDSDDMMVPRRLEWQVAYLDAHPDVTVVGGAYRCMDEAGRAYGKVIPCFTAADEVTVQVTFRCEVWKGNATGRAETLRAYGFDEGLRVADDYALWLRMSRGGLRLANVPRVVGYYRMHGQQSIRVHRRTVDDEVLCIVQDHLRQLGVTADAEDVRRHLRLGKLRGTPKRKHLRWAEPWLRRIVAANRVTAMYPPALLERVVARVWRRTCWNSLRRTGPYGMVKLITADFG